MTLTDLAIRTAKPTHKTRKLFDSHGLYLEISPQGGKWWRIKFRWATKERSLSLGTYPLITLAEARRRRDAIRLLLSEGIDPSQVRRRQKQERMAAAAPTFETVGRAWFLGWRRSRSPTYAAQVLHQIEKDIFPYLGSKPIALMKPLDIVAMARAVEKRGALEIARRTIQITGQIFRYAVGQGIVENNPTREITPDDFLESTLKQNHHRVSAEELPALLKAIKNYHGLAQTKLALSLMALTFIRVNELTGARWEEIDLEKRRWTIPAGRMKMKAPHIVPLAQQTIGILEVLKNAGAGVGLLFPGENNPNKPMSRNTLLFALYRMGFKGKMTVHGFRGVASTILHEMGQDHAHIELQLAHQERNRVSAAYNYAKYLPQREKMMQHWADYLDSIC